MDLAQYTNVPQLYAELELEKYNCALWHCHDHNSDKINIHNNTPVLPEHPVDLVKFIRTKDCWKTADKIFVIGQECFAAELPKFDSRIHAWDSMSSDNRQLHFNPFWIHYVKWVEKSANGLPNLLDPRNNTPEYYFDCLLGKTRPNKDFLAEFITNHNLTDRILFSSFGTNSQWIQGHDYDDVKITNTSQDNINYGNRMTAMKSLFIPYKIYNNSWFTIVPETLPNKNFITEKTVKALIGQRLFIVFSGPKHLELLRQIGFRTFNKIIDESYDDEVNDTKRWTMATEQIKYLLTQNPIDIYNAALPTLQYNQQLVLNTDWNKFFHQSMLRVAKL